MPEERQVTIQAETVEEYNERVRTVAATMPFQGEPTFISVDPAPEKAEIPDEPVAEEPVEPEAESKPAEESPDSDVAEEHEPEDVEFNAGAETDVDLAHEEEAEPAEE